MSEDNYNQGNYLQTRANYQKPRSTPPTRKLPRPDLSVEKPVTEEEAVRSNKLYDTNRFLLSKVREDMTKPDISDKVLE